MTIAGNNVEITSTMVDIRIDAKEGFNVGMENNEFVILNTTLNRELMNEGIAREIVSKIQQIRKNMNLELTDRIIIKYKSSETIKEAILEFSDYIKRETLANDIIVDEKLVDEFVVNDELVKISVEKSL